MKTIKLNEPENKIFWKAWTVFEAFRRLGFTPDEIYFAYRPNNFITVTEVSVVLKTQNKEFCVGLGELSPIQNESELKDKWTYFCNETLPKATQNELSDKWESSIISKDSVGFMKSFLDKGFYIPRDQN